MPSNFWARKLAERDPKPRPQPTANPLVPWWSSSGPTHPPVIAEHSHQQPVGEYQSQQPTADGHKVIMPADINLRRFQSLHQESGCPDCGGSNYFGPTPNARKRCFDCGYPILQSTSGVSNVGAAGGAAGTPARQAPRMTITDGQGRILGTTEAATGYKGQSTYNPRDPQAGRIS